MCFAIEYGNYQNMTLTIVIQDQDEDLILIQKIEVFVSSIATSIYWVLGTRFLIRSIRLAKLSDFDHYLSEYKRDIISWPKWEILEERIVFLCQGFCIQISLKLSKYI